MRIVSEFRSVGWICCFACALLSGCARFGWHNASRDRGDIDEDASFIASPLNKPAPLGPKVDQVAKANLPPVVKAEPAKPSIAQPPAITSAPANTKPSPDVERAALEAELRRGMQSAPDTTPKQMQEFERLLAEVQGPLAMQQLRQLNAIEQLRRRQAEAVAKATAEATATADVPQQEAKTATPSPAPTVAEAPPKSAVIRTVGESPVESTPATTTPPRSVAERLQQAKERSSTPQRSGIFDGKVKTSAAEQAALEANQLALHTSRKPTDDEAVPDASQKKPESPALSWREHLAATITALQKSLQNKELPDEIRLQQETQLRMLYLLSDQTDLALQEIAGLEPDQQDYWRSQLHSLQVSLAIDGTPVKGRRATLALRPLREAVDHLASQATLDVRNVALCKEVTIWGNYREFEKYEFKPDQEVLLYFEVENFAVSETPQGYASEFVSSYEIFDPAGRRVAEQQLPVAQEVCKNRRRDYFVRYHLHVPKQLAAGEYTLQLTVEDQKGHKFGQGSVKFKVI